MDHWKETLWSCALPHVRIPAQYVGGEWNMVRKDPAVVALRFCLAFPDTYSIGMSSTGLQVLYGTLNARDDVYAERVFAPWPDMQARLRSARAPLCS
ncbi:MAG: B12-binding domain-containing radical SAM protein, partial [Candidatus Brocadiia bacterium]